MSDSESENEQRLTLEDLEGSDTEMLSGDEDGPMDILTQQRVTINNEVNYTYLLPKLSRSPSEQGTATATTPRLRIPTCLILRIH
jgi:hypothetical protein